MRLFVVLLGLFTIPESFSQKNLVPDPDFGEVFLQTGNPVPQSNEWLFFKEGEIGFLHPDSRYWSPKRNPHGEQVPKEGKALAWLKVGGVTSENSNNYGDIKRYYFLTQLTEPMEKGLTYYVEGHISFADKANCAIDQFGFHFAEQKPDSTHEEYKQDFVKFVIPQVGHNGGIVTDAENWTKISGHYTAKGGEEWLWIGHFGLQHFFQYKHYKRRSHFIESYYYLDAVSVLKPPLSDSLRPPDLTMPELAFAVGSTRLSGLAKQALDSLGQHLSNRKLKRIRVLGHTDATGSTARNQALSQQRAQAVANYLMNTFSFLKPSLFEVNGVGSSRPTTTNQTAEGRSQNRRVEVWVDE